MTTDPRALIAEGRKHDEAMTAAPWTFDEPSAPAGSVDIVGVRLLEDGRAVPTDEHGDPIVVAEWVAQCDPHRDAAGIAWLRTNLAALLDGYASALDEVDAQAETALGCLDLARHQAATLRTSLAEQASDLTRKDSYILQLETRAARAEAGLFEANLELAELKLVIEQQDRDMARVRAALVKVHDDAVYDNNHERYLEIADILDQGAPCTEATK